MGPKLALDIIRDACRLNDDSGAALQARVRQLVEMGVSGLTRESAHARHRYGLTEIVELAVAIVLMKGHMAPAAAARLVREGWPKLVPFALSGIGDALPDRFRRLRTDPVGMRVLIEGNALADLGRKPVRGARGGGSLAGIRPFDGARNDDADVSGDWDAGIYVDFGRFMPTLFSRVVGLAATPEDVWESLTRLRQSEGRSA